MLSMISRAEVESQFFMEVILFLITEVSFFLTVTEYDMIKATLENIG